MAPEMLEDNEFSEKADVYSFAVTVWEVLTGERPFAGLKPAQVIMKVCMKGHRPPVPEKTGLPAIVEVMQQCWSPAPDDRPTFAEAVASIHHGTKTVDGGASRPSDGGGDGGGGDTHGVSEQNRSGTMSSNGLTAGLSRIGEV
jgi:hypothetical protein